MKFFRYIPVLLLSAVAFAGCLKDRAEGCDPAADGQIVIQIKTPESFASRAGTRALDAAKELDIRTLDVLVFEDRGGGSETFMYHVVAEHTPSVTDPAVQYFKTTLQVSKNSERQRLVLLANMPADCRSKLSQIEADMEKEAALDKLVFAAGGVWTADDLPMWGESDRSVVVTERTTGGAFGTIQMLYSMARVDVGFNADADWTEFRGLPGYRIVEVRLMNTSKAGYMAPHKADLAAGLPTIPPPPGGIGGFLSQTITHTLPTTGVMYQIYAAEYANKGETYGEASYLLVKVREAGTTDSWYRIDFYRRGDNISAVERLDLLRGHLYKVNITGVDGPGYPTLEQAAGSMTTLLDASVTVWNEHGIDIGLDAVKEEKYFLYVDKAEFKFNGMARADEDSNNKVGIRTEYPYGWKIAAIKEVADDGTESNLENGWLNVDQTFGYSSDTYEPVSIEVSAYDSTTPRRGRIYVEAGKWTYTINVEQKLGTLDVSPSTLNLKFDNIQTPMAEARLTMDTEFGWMFDRVEYTIPDELHEDDDESEFEGWLGVFDPELDLSGRDPFDLFRKDFDLSEGGEELRESRNAYLRVDVNTTHAVRSATVWFVNEEGLEASVEVNQGWIKCGAGGKVKYREIGENTYATHIYGTNIRKIGESMAERGYFKRMSEVGEDPGLEEIAHIYIQQIPNEYAISCFMVENSQEGDYTYWNHILPAGDDEVVGPYYLSEDAESACPTGWRLPNDTDVNNILVPNVALNQYGLQYFTPDYSLWLKPESLTSFMGMDTSGNLTSAGELGIQGFYHMSDNNYCHFVYDQSSGLLDITSNYWNSNWSIYAPVRCVEDVNPYDYPMYDR